MYCGALLASPPAERPTESVGERAALRGKEDPTPKEADPERDKTERFERLQKLPTYPDLIARRPPAKILLQRIRGQLLAGVIALALLGFLAFLFVYAFAFAVIFPVVAAVIVVVRLVRTMQRARAVRRGTLQAVPALVVEKRGCEPDESSVDAPRCRVLMEGPDAARSELDAPPKIAAELNPGDMGVAYVSDGALVAFERTEV